MDKNQDIPRIRKGDAFVQMEPHPLVFMEMVVEKPKSIIK